MTLYEARRRALAEQTQRHEAQGRVLAPWVKRALGIDESGARLPIKVYASA